MKRACRTCRTEVPLNRVTAQDGYSLSRVLEEIRRMLVELYELGDGIKPLVRNTRYSKHRPASIMSRWELRSFAISNGTALIP